MLDHRHLIVHLWNICRSAVALFAADQCRCSREPSTVAELHGDSSYEVHSNAQILLTPIMQYDGLDRSPGFHTLQFQVAVELHVERGRPGSAPLYAMCSMR